MSKQLWPFGRAEDPPFTLRIKIPHYYILAIPDVVGNTDWYLIIVGRPANAKCDS